MNKLTLQHLNAQELNLSFNSTIKGIIHLYNDLLLTNVGDFISHHVFIVVDSGIWNIRLVSHRHDIQFLKTKKGKQKKEKSVVMIRVYSRCFYSMLGLTIWTLIP